MQGLCRNSQFRIQRFSFEARATPCHLQHECIRQAILGMDVICQAKSGMGKTAVFVLSTLQQIEPVAGQIAHMAPFIPTN
ncbi:hypothetical protein L1987_14793 [Smallanthus sonchifolius]|uniref:Uncharacterized protein n=1 Tax=Smallanthus sonchifolius TaxID=185202 RepID=A0ACB9J464_9ASTR|nr:hypothetical protein L1987_14793 [Smallanthus sonchifolius]